MRSLPTPAPHLASNGESDDDAYCDDDNVLVMGMVINADWRWQ